MRRKKRVRIISTRTVMCNILLHYARANCICCIYIHLYSCLCVCVYSIHNTYIYIHTYTCMYTLIYVGIFWQWPSCWCRWWLVFGHSVDFWSSQPLLIQFKTSRTAADWTKHTPYNHIYQILLFQTSPIIQTKIFLDSKVMPYSNSSTFSLAVFWLLMRNCMGIR